MAVGVNRLTDSLVLLRELGRMSKMETRVLKQPCDCRYGEKRQLALITGWLPALALVFAGGCASQSPPSIPQQTARPANRYIYVTPRNLPDDCYTALGTVTVRQGFGEAAVDPDGSETAKQLRAAALSKYPADVDAVINVQSTQNDVGTMVTVSGEAVRLEDSTTVKCTVRDAEKAMDSAAEDAATGIGGAGVGGLTGGETGAISAGLVGVAAMGAYGVVEHEELKSQEKAELADRLDAQRREIAQLLKERSHLQKCQNDDVPLATCEASAQSSDQSDQSDSEDKRKEAVNATNFQIRKQIQEQQDYIKQLKGQIAQLKWDMGGHQ